MAKKMMKNNTTCPTCHMPKNWYVVGGVVAIVLGIALWANVLSLERTIAIGLVLIGIKKLVKSTTC